MGKSLGNAVYLVDNEEIVSKKIMAAVTDPNRIKKDDKGNPDICMVYYYHNLVNKDNVNHDLMDYKVQDINRKHEPKYNKSTKDKSDDYEL